MKSYHNINICLVGAANIGKTSLLRTVFRFPNPLNNEKSLIPYAYFFPHQEETNMEKVIKTSKEIEDSVKDMYLSCSFTFQKFIPIYFEIDNPFSSKHPPDVKYFFYDLPGLQNDFSVSWIKKNIHEIDIIIFMADLQNTQKHLEFLKMIIEIAPRRILIICLVNKCDSMIYDVDSEDYVFLDKSSEKVFIYLNNALAEISKEYRRVFSKNITPFFPLSLQNQLGLSYFYQEIENLILQNHQKILKRHLKKELKSLENYISCPHFTLILENCYENFQSYLLHYTDLKISYFWETVKGQLIRYLNEMSLININIIKGKNLILHEKMIEIHEELIKHLTQFIKTKEVLSKMEKYPVDFFESEHSVLIQKLTTIYDQMTLAENIPDAYYTPLQIIYYLETIANFCPDKIEYYSQYFLQMLIEEKNIKKVVENTELLDLIVYLSQSVENFDKLKKYIYVMLISRISALYQIVKRKPDTEMEKFIYYLFTLKKVCKDNLNSRSSQILYVTIKKYISNSLGSGLFNHSSGREICVPKVTNFILHCEDIPEETIYLGILEKSVIRLLQNS